MSKNNVSANEKNSISLRSRVLISFLVFASVVIAVLWLFQTVFLDDIYRLLKMHSLDECADVLEEAANGLENKNHDMLEAIADLHSQKYGVCISLYEIRETPAGKDGVAFCDKHVNQLCFVHNVLTPQVVGEIYNSAKLNGNRTVRKFSLSDMFGEEQDVSDYSGMNIIMARVVDYGDDEMLILLNAELLPMQSTVETLVAQLGVISIILVVLSVIMAYIFSHNLSNPIVKMSSEASKLALGDYDVNFEGGNCTEMQTLSETLNTAAYELSRLDKMQKDLIANVSHDLRTPLTMIEGYTEAMRDLPGEATPENMQIVIDETHRLTDLVNDMLEVSRYQSGKQPLNAERINLSAIIRTTIERYNKLKERDAYSFVFDCKEDVYVNADEAKLLQVIYNLANNAVNYTGADKRVIIVQTVEKDFVTVEVIDTGEGIPEEELPLVWERYYKVNSFHKRSDAGTGLGLSIVKSILELHGAQFGVKSKVGEGSSFWFTLPISRE